MRVRVDDAGRDGTATGIKNPSASRNPETCRFAYSYDAVPLDNNNAIGDRQSPGAVNEHSVSYYQSIIRHTRIIYSTPGECDQQQSHAELVSHPSYSVIGRERPG